MQECGIIKFDDYFISSQSVGVTTSINPYFSSKSKVSLVFGQMNETPGARFRVPNTALSMAEHLQDVAKQDLLVFMDNIFRFLDIVFTEQCLLRSTGTERLSTNA